MTTSKDREQLHALNGIAAPHPRDSYKVASLPWKNEPTPIPLPGGPRMVHQSGTNPYGDNPNRPKNLGNPTSNRVLGMTSRPRKRVKLEHDLVASGPYTQQEDRTNLRSKRSHEVSLAPETIDVDDSSPLNFGFHGDDSYTNLISSPDELNTLGPSTEEAHSSKYQFSTPSHGSTVRNNNAPIAPDGKNTEWAKKKFSQATSGHILGRNSAPSGQVKEVVAKLEAGMEDPPLINLTEKLKTRMKPKTKKLKESYFFPLQQSSRQQPSQALISKNVLPLKALYIDDQLVSAEGLEISWRQGDKICITSGSRRKHIVFGPFDIRINTRSLTYHDDDGSESPVHDPIFQLKTILNGRRGTNNVKLLVFRLDCSSPGAQESYYKDLLNWLKVRIDEKDIIRASARERLWESAATRVSELSTQQGVSEKSRRLDELRGRARRSLINDQNKPLAPQKSPSSESSLRITPIPSPPISVSVSDSQKLIQRSRRDASDPSSVIPRRSTRNCATQSPAIDSDEVILVYPPGVPGAVNITNGDLLRLEPGEFLNDTLIEFGLKLWLKELEQTDPTLASQIHVFNSFFYKKLNHQKKGTSLGGYESVRKWTSKFDIFQKKYIIVPINEHLHWYFAIICEPEHVLVPTALSIPSTRHTRQSVSEPMITEEPNETPAASKPVSISVSENDRNEDKSTTPSEAEVEHTLHDFKGSCSISNIGSGEDAADVDREKSPSALSYVSDTTYHVLRRPFSDEKMAMDLADDLPVNLGNTDPVDAARFYAQRTKNKGKRKVDPEPESLVMEIDDDDDGGSALNDTPKTYIFTFDSLGARHPQAIKRLSTYLKMEAQDKKKVVNASSALGKTALVPVQPNFCDCGIYLLHLAQTFMSDPVHYRRMILAQKYKAVPSPERQVAWYDHQVTNKREALKARIVQLSDQWKNERAAKEEAKQKEVSNSRTVEVAESSDCEIDILEPTPSANKAKSGGKKNDVQPANRLRG